MCSSGRTKGTHGEEHYLNAIEKKAGVLSNFSIKLSVGLEAVMSSFGWESKVGLFPGLSVATSTVCALELIEMLSFVGFGTSKHDD